MATSFRYLYALTLFVFSGLCLVEANESRPLSPAEADAIIAQREAAKAERKAARLAELEEAEVLSEGEDALPNGRKIIIREVRAPENIETPLAETSSDEASKRPEGIAEQLAWIKEQEKLQRHKVQMFSCTIYDREVTQVRWTHDDERYLAYTNADFNYLRGVTSVETKTDRYDYFMGIGNASSHQSRESLPPLPAFNSDRSEYALLEGDPANAAATAGLEALLGHYDANLDSLKIAHQRNEALTAAQKRYDEAHPEPKEDFILQFWLPEKKGSSE